MTAHLYLKRGTWHYVLIYEPSPGVRKQKWIDTHLPERGNKRKATQMESQIIAEWAPVLEPTFIQTVTTGDAEKRSNTSTSMSPPRNGDILFSDYLINWLENKRGRVQDSTFAGYQKNVLHTIAPYFAKRRIYLSQVNDVEIERFYFHQRSTGHSGNTLLHYQTILNQSLRKAAKDHLITCNPITLMGPEQKPKKKKFTPTVYNEKDVELLMHAIKDTPLALAIMLDITYGLRRSELAGLRWSSIDFDAKSIHICFKVLDVKIDGKSVRVMTDQMKTTNSNRTLPLLPSIEEALLRHREQIEINQKLLKKSYSREYLDFVFVNQLGVIWRPDYFSEQFKAALKNNNLKYIRFHDLRHTCATMLRRKKISLQDIQFWLGHSTYQTTADIYSHFDYMDKIETANAAAQILSEVNIF